jgi:L,D-peptidoglycan transpeptidase YkuD (ErfK/YbiS/YcfS/YnhG family)
MYSLKGYGMGLVIEYNTCPVEKGRGSCIFLHIWDRPDRGTKGCTAISKEDMANLSHGLTYQRPLTYSSFQRRSLKR